MIPGKVIAGAAISTIVISISLALISEFQSMAEANGSLKSDKKELKQSLIESEAEKLDQANQITHLSELFIGVMADRKAAKKKADYWQGEYNDAINNDDDLKKWDSTVLPDGLIRLYNSGRKASSPDQAGKSGGAGVSDAANR